MSIPPSVKAAYRRLMAWKPTSKGSPSEPELRNLILLCKRFVDSLVAEQRTSDLHARTEQFRKLTAEQSDFDKARRSALKAVANVMEGRGMFSFAPNPGGPKTRIYQFDVERFLANVRTRFEEFDTAISLASDFLKPGAPISNQQKKVLSAWLERVKSLQLEIEEHQLGGCAMLSDCSELFDDDSPDVEKLDQLIARFKIAPKVLVKAVKSAARDLVEAVELGHGLESKPLESAQEPSRRPAYLRDQQLLEWAKAYGLTNARMVPHVRNKWKGLSQAERQKFAPHNQRELSYDVVRKGIEAAQKDEGK